MCACVYAVVCLLVCVLVCCCVGADGRGDPLAKMHEQMNQMGANLPPGAALSVQIPDEVRTTSAKG